MVTERSILGETNFIQGEIWRLPTVSSPRAPGPAEAAPAPRHCHARMLIAHGRRSDRLAGQWSVLGCLSGTSRRLPYLPYASQRRSRTAAEHRPDLRDGCLLTFEASYHNQ